MTTMAPPQQVEPKPLVDPRPVAVRVHGLGKRFRIYARPFDRLWEWLGRKTRRGAPMHTDFWAVKDVSFEVPKGECLGIIGANGSGKSTLLKMLTGALHPTTGTYSVSGRVLSLIELGTGLNPMLTGRENIVNSAALLGFPASFAREKMAEIEAFAELAEFFDRPVNLYSSGMKVRLAFSMFACFRPEVFIVDEALSVGDVFFQQKCATRIRELLDGGVTMIFVSHDQSAILNLCQRAVVMSHGEAVFQGVPEEAISRYLSTLSGPARVWTKRASPVSARPDAGADANAKQIIDHDVTGARKAHRHGSGQVRIVAARVLDPTGADAMRAGMGETLTVQVLLEAHAPVEAPRCAIRFFDRFGKLICGAGTFQLSHRLPSIGPGDRIVVTFTVKMDLEPGDYTFGLGTGEPAPEDPNDGIAHDRLDRLGPVVITQPAGVRPFYGAARLPMKVSHTVCETAGQHS